MSINLFGRKDKYKNNMNEDHDASSCCCFWFLLSSSSVSSSSYRPRHQNTFGLSSFFFHLVLYDQVCSDQILIAVILYDNGMLSCLFYLCVRYNLIHNRSISSFVKIVRYRTTTVTTTMMLPVDLGTILVDEDHRQIVFVVVSALLHHYCCVCYPAVCLNHRR